MGFTPLPSPRQATDPGFPRVDPEVQADRDAEAARLVADELQNTDDPAQQAILQKEYRLRFGGEAPVQPGAAVQRGFTPLPGNEATPPAKRGFTPLAADSAPEQPSVLRNVLLNNPLTAVGEAALNFGSQAVGLPVAGIAGLGTAAANAIGLTDKTGADVVHAVGSALTYQPRGEMGKGAAGIVAYPFEKLAEAGQYAGGKTLEATGSPLVATAVDTAVNALPMAIAPAVKGGKAMRARLSEAPETKPGFTPLEEPAPTLPYFPDPQEFGASAFAEKARQHGLSERQINDLAPAEARDAVTGYFRSEHRVLTIERAQRYVEDNAVPAWYVESDIANLGGLNDHFKNNHAESNKVYRQIADIYAEEMDKAGARSIPIRQGGDEINAVIIGGTPETVQAAIRNATERVRQLAEDAGLANIPHPKGKEPGIGLYSGYAPIRPGVPLAKIFEEAAHGLDAGKKGRKNVGRISDETPDGVRPDERPGSTEPARGSAVGEQGAARSGLDERIERPAAGPDQSAEFRGARYALIDADRLRPSHDTNLRETPDYPATLTRADWTRHDAEQRVQGIVADFDPARLAEAAGDDHGAPIARRDGTIEAGNARAIALQRIYRADGLKADAYRAHLRDNAERLGLDPAAVDEIKKPVLVRVPADDMPASGTVNQFAPGANYVGFIDDAARAGGEAATKSGTGKPIRREDILIDFAKAMGAGIYEGRVQGKNRLGFFRPRLEEVRIKKHADLETAAHEMAHLLDDRVPEIRKTWKEGPNAKAISQELRGLSYDAGKVYEGFAEYVRHYMTQPDVARQRAPKFTAWFDDFVSRSQYGPAIRDARKRMTDWFNQDAIDRARSKIGDHDPLSKALDDRWDAFRQATVDDLHGVYRMERELKAGKIEPNGPYESARLSRASASIADGALRFGAPFRKPDGSFGWKGKGLEEILRPVAEHLDNALLYFVGRSSRELLAQGREHLFTNGEIDAMLRLRRPEFDQAFKEYQAWNAAVLDFAEAHGVINPDARRLWQRTEYMPFHRVGQADGFKGKPGDWTGIKALTGGTENLKDILSNMAGNAAMLIDKAVKNEARLKIAQLAEANGGGKFMVKIQPESRPVKVEKQAVIDAVLKSMGIDKALNPNAARVEKKLRKLFEDSPAMIDLLQSGMPPAGGNVVAVLRAGKPTWYEVGDPLLLRSLEAIDRQPPQWIVKWLGWPKRIGQAAITLTPDFMIANMARDTIMGSIMSRAGFKPVIDSLQGMRLRLTKDPIYREYIANGGGLSSIYLEEGKFRAKLEKFYRDQRIDYRTVLDAPAKLMGFLETLGDAFEMSTRLGEYKRAVEAGENPRHAAYMAREVSTDFAMRGDSKALGFLYDTVMFLKPALLSWDRLARGLVHDPNRGAIATKAGIMATMSTALYLLNRDDPRYQDLPDWDRDAHWHFFVGNQHFRYPKIWEVGAMSSAAERTVEKIIEADPQGLGKDFARIIGATFSLNLMPQIIAPLWEQGRNRNSFTNAPIETPGMENMQPFMRAKPETSETLKALGMASRELPEALQVNPTRAEALVRGYFNTWALYGLALSDRAFFGDRLPEGRTDQLPVVRRFYSEEPPLHTRWESKFYDVLGEAKRLHGSLRELDKIGRPEIADAKEKEPLAPEAAALERANKHLHSINAEMRKVRRDDSMAPAEKRARLDALVVERNDLLKRAVQDSQAAQKARKESVQ